MDLPDTQPPESPPSPTSSQARGIRRRLMERVADTETSHLTIDDADGDWQPFLDGVAIKVLREHAGVLSYLLRLDPGAVLPAHRHPGDEECVVLHGRLRVGSVSYTHLDVYKRQAAPRAPCSNATSRPPRRARSAAAARARRC